MTTHLSDTFYLDRSGRYANPLNSNDRLPVVYGDLTDGTLGIWELPCIDTVAYVYCFAGHDVLSIANGNTITIYENDLELDPGMYTFNESNNYEGKGNIATIDFSTPKTGAIITARGKGKASGATLIENIIDIIDDFLTVQNDFTSSIYDATSKALSKAVFTAQAYEAAGIIDQDNVIWETITRMMASFFGSAYMNGEDKLVLEIDVNRAASGYAAIIRRNEASLTEAKIRLENIINQCPCSYAYNYYQQGFKGHTDDSAHGDAASQAIYGIRKPAAPYPFYWCRDLTTVQKVEDLIVGKLKSPIYEIELTTLSVKHLNIDIGDHVIYSAERLYDGDGIALLNQFWKINSVKQNYSENQLIFGALYTGNFLTIAYLADGGTDPILLIGEHGEYLMSESGDLLSSGDIGGRIADGSILAGNNRDRLVY